MRPAFSANAGSRGKIQVRCRQGCRASWLSHRQTVVPLIEATNPAPTTSRFNSDRENRDRGLPRRCGSSHASALTATMIPGGKACGGPATRLFIEARKTLLEKAFAPLGYNLTRRIETCGNDIVREPLGRVQDDPGAQDVAIR